MENDDRIKMWRDKHAQDAAASGTPAVQSGSARTAERMEMRRDDPRPAGLSRSSAVDADLDQTRLGILERRNQRWRESFRRAMLFVAMPVLVVLLYAGLVATPLYEGDAVFTVQTSGTSAPAPGAGIFALTAGGSTIADAFKAREFILSRPMMDHMQTRFRFLDHFASFRMDPLTRFNSPIGINRDPFQYYLRRVNVSVDVQEGILRLHVQARTKQDAIRFGNGILAAAEQHVNSFSQRIGEDQIASLTEDVQRAEMQVGDTRRSLASVQAERGDLSPQQTATSVYQLISSLELQLTEAESQRDSLRAEGLSNSPLLPGLEARVRQLRAQISEQRQRLVSPGGGSLAQTLNQFEGASVRKEVAQARWESTLNTLQQAYLQVLQERRYFVLVVGMSVEAFAAVRDWLMIAGPLLALMAFLYAIMFILKAVRPDLFRFRGGALIKAFR